MNITWERTVQIAGLVGFFHEMIVYNGERPAFLATCVALIGIKFVRDFDKKRRNGNGKNG